MAPGRSSSSILIGNCQVFVQAKNCTSKLDQNTLHLSLSGTAKIKISVAEGQDQNKHNVTGEFGSEDNHTGSYFFTLVNPKGEDSQTKFQIQEVLKLYSNQLPAMNYAANTGKQSMFLERCVSNGKYCTLILNSYSNKDIEEVVAAITYQIIPTDTQNAEVPLAAVNSHHQRKGLGTMICRELIKRLQSIGIRTVFCWGDKESEGFWLKQGFMPVGDVDSKGRARRLPIKADIRRALCFPGGSTLMVSHLNSYKSADSEGTLKFRSPVEPLENSFLYPFIQTHSDRVAKGYHAPSEGVHQMTSRIEHSQPQEMVKDEFQKDEKKDDTGAKHCSCSIRGGKKRVWEASYTSLNSKKVKGGHLVNCRLGSSQFDGSFSGISSNASVVEVVPRDSFNCICKDKKAEEHHPLNLVTEASGCTKPFQGGESHRIMLMNMDNDAKRSTLSKIIEELGGIVTVDGHLSTHVVTGQVRKTLNFCIALCSGSWIVSPCWLKESFRKGRFVDEVPFVLKDEDYKLKYGIELKDTVQRARASPQTFLCGYDLCLAAHLQPPIKTIEAIIRSAGGNVIVELDKVNQPSKTIYLACGEDMEEALLAARKGIWTFSSEWFMNCIMKQELDLEASQFAESL